MATNYENLLGTPEKAAKFIASIPKNCDETGSECEDCQLQPSGSCCWERGLLNWLQEECDE